MALDQASKAEIIAKFGKDSKDTGSPAVQIALLSARITILTDHLKENKKDHSSKLGMLPRLSHQQFSFFVLPKHQTKVATHTSW